MTIAFVHPITKAPLFLSCEGALCADPEGHNRVLEAIDGIYDFASLQKATPDRNFYDTAYEARVDSIPALTSQSVWEMWHRMTAYEELRDAVGNVTGKDVLLVGNGASIKEMAFALDGARVVYSDLSVSVVRAMKARFHTSRMREQCAQVPEFHAIDACHLPFPDKSFDVIYGCAFAHHLPNLHGLLLEVFRCLRPRGRCVFLDDAYAAWWQAAKRTLLRPVQHYAHWRRGFSPEDQRASARGGYRHEELREAFLSCNGVQTLFWRTMLLEHLMRRGAEKLLTVSISNRLAHIGRNLDRKVLGTRWLRSHGLLLVWGGERR